MNDLFSFTRTIRVAPDTIANEMKFRSKLYTTKRMIKNYSTAKFVAFNLKDLRLLRSICVQSIQLISHLSVTFAPKPIELVAY